MEKGEIKVKKQTKHMLPFLQAFVHRILHGHRISTVTIKIAKYYFLTTVSSYSLKDKATALLVL